MSTTSYVTDAATLGTGLLLGRLIFGVLMVAHGGRSCLAGSAATGSQAPPGSLSSWASAPAGCLSLPRPSPRW